MLITNLWVTKNLSIILNSSQVTRNHWKLIGPVNPTLAQYLQNLILILDLHKSIIYLHTRAINRSISNLLRASICDPLHSNVLCWTDIGTTPFIFSSRNSNFIILFVIHNCSNDLYCMHSLQKRWHHGSHGGVFTWSSWRQKGMSPWRDPIDSQRRRYDVACRRYQIADINLKMTGVTLLLAFFI